MSTVLTRPRTNSSSPSVGTSKRAKQCRRTIAVIMPAYVVANRVAFSFRPMFETAKPPLAANYFSSHQLILLSLALSCCRFLAKNAARKVAHKTRSKDCYNQSHNQWLKILCDCQE